MRTYASRCVLCARSFTLAVLPVRGNITGSFFLLQVPTGTTYQAGRRLHGPTDANSVVAAPPLWQFTRNSPPGRLACVEVRQRAMLAELAARRDEGAKGPAS